MVMKFLLGAMALLLTGQLSAQSTGLNAYWDDGLKFQSKDSLFRFSVGGRVHYDIAFSGQSKGLDSLYKTNGNRVEVRRARLSFEGMINKAFAYEFEFTFGERLEYADMYFAFLRVPKLERLTVGHFREPFGLEEMTSSNVIVMMERSLTSAFGPSRNTGVMVQRQFLKEKLRGYAGVFRITDDLGGDLTGKGNHSFSTRWVYTPINEEAINKTIHLGLAFNRFTPDDSTHKIETTNEVNTNPEYITTGDVNLVRTVNQWGSEAAFAKGPLVVQAEWIQSYATFYKQANQSQRMNRYKSYYIIASYFLKGDERRYSNNGNRFSSIKVRRDTSKPRLPSAMEAAIRFSHIDVSDATQPIRQLSNLTAGLNWYFNSNSRLMINYVYTFLNSGMRANTFQLRMQASF